MHKDAKHKQEGEKGDSSPKNSERRKLIESGNGKEINISNPVKLNENFLS